VVAAAVVAAAGMAAAGAVSAAMFFGGFVFWGFGLAVGLVGASAATVAEETIAAGTSGLGLGEVAGLGVSAGFREAAGGGVGLGVSAIGLRIGALVEGVVLRRLAELGRWLAEGLLAGVVGCWTAVGGVAVEAGTIAAVGTVVGLRAGRHGWLRGAGVVAGLLVGAVGSFVAAVGEFISAVRRFISAIRSFVVAIGAVLVVVGAVAFGWTVVIAAAVVSVHGARSRTTLWAAATG